MFDAKQIAISLICMNSILIPFPHLYLLLYSLVPHQQAMMGRSFLPTDSDLKRDADAEREHAVFDGARPFVIVLSYISQP